MTDREKVTFKNFRKCEEFMNTTVPNNIETYRKGTLKLTVTDKEGNPIPDAKVTFKQKNHAFRFGANLFMLDELETEEKNEKYKTYFKEIFNLATLPFYWRDLEPEKGKQRYEIGSAPVYRRPTPDLCIKYCEENNIEPKLHCLTYDNFIPFWLLDKDVSEIKREYCRRFSEISERYADKIPTMEVTNELICGSDQKRSDFFWADDNAEWSFRTADKYFPKNKLIINEANLWEVPYPTTNRNNYYMQIEKLLSQNVRIDSIGMQFHSFFYKEHEYGLVPTRYNPELVYGVLDRFAQLNRPLQITEMTIPAYTQDAEDERLQAELIKNVYSIFFSHPAMEAIIYWNVPDGYAAFAPQGDMTSGENYFRGGLVRFDFSKKPAFEMLDHLINHEWQSEGTVTTDEDGEARIRGFYGDYDIVIEKGSAKESITLPIKKNSENLAKTQL